MSAEWEESDDEEAEQECCSFGFKYANRLLSLGVSATSLMAWDSMFNVLMPATDTKTTNTTNTTNTNTTNNTTSSISGNGSAKNWSIWHCLLFTLIMFVALSVMAVYYNRHQKKLAAAAKKSLDDDIKDDCEDEGAALVEQSYANLTNAMGYITIQVWLNVYPIPVDVTWGGVAAAFAGVVFVVFLSEVVFRKCKAGSAKAIWGNVNANIVTQGVWLITNMLVPLWRRWGKADGWQPIDLGVPGAHNGPPLWVGATAFGVSVIYIFVVNFIASKICGVTKSVNDNTSPLEAAMCDKTRGMINQACLYTTATLIMQNFNQQSGWNANVWWWCQVAFLGSAVLLVILQFGVSSIPCPCDDVTKFKADAVNLMTLMLGFICGHFYTGWIETDFKVSRYMWIPLAILFQAMSLGLEEFRVSKLATLATESLTYLKMSSAE